MKRLTLKITQNDPGSDPISIEMDCYVTKQQGEDHLIAAMLLEAEQHGNDGKARVHLLMVE